MERFIFTELDSYLNGRGSWKPFHRSKGTQGGPSKTTLNTIDDQTIPEQPINNANLGIIVQNIIDMRYPPKQMPIPSSDIPQYLPLRLLCLGNPFSGRKTLAAFLKQKYGLEVLKIEDIIKEAIDLVSNIFLRVNNVHRMLHHL